MARLNAPGRGVVEPCRPCEGTGEEGKGRCLDCGGSGYLVWRACPRCGSLHDWEYRNGASETSGMVCRACGASWDMDQPEWVIQVLPDEFLAETA